MQFELLPPVPAVVLARKLRQSPLFEFASVDELFRLSTIARQVRHSEGVTFQKEGTPAEHIQILIEGKVVISGPDGAQIELSPPALLGCREVLEGSKLRETASAVERSTCLSLGAEEFRSLLSDNIELAQGLFRMLLKRSIGAVPRVLRAAVRLDETRLQAGGRPGLTPVDKILLLQQLPIFSRATPDELIELTSVVRPVSLITGDTISGQGGSSSIWVILSGAILIEPPEAGDPLAAAAGDVIGVDETLSGVATGWRARVQEEGLALEIEREDLFGLLGDQVELLQGLFSAVFQSIPLEAKNVR